MKPLTTLKLPLKTLNRSYGKLRAVKGRDKRSLRLRQGRKILAATLILLLLLTSIRIWEYFQPQTAEAGWFNDNWTYRKKLTIDDTGGAGGANLRVKFDIDTAESVENNAVNFNSTTQTFTAGMAKRNAPGPFTTAPMHQGDPDNTDNLVDDYLTMSRGNQVSGNFYDNINTNHD